ncbi:lactate racemase domain-containing protein [Alicyclobacillus fastidiosus]|uniref:Lactate racemase domain-containing protein n=1 Tax=Alicyclobacillus fastidiosus TaxID=392011 RepID=A0ABV5AEE2_9BACL|nr:lactate racemase domain-containing protein [Alicyclobacillus fastidiosus]WEH09789.1 lactate racemase domain-containing protein [Alicyclobacillus fastidiosus]
MSVIRQLVESVPLPNMVEIRQRFPNPTVEDVDDTVNRAFAAESSSIAWPSSGEIAVVVGSRGISEIDQVTRAVVNQLKSRGYQPFVIPGMGSHGGATAQGQKDVLASLGVTEDFVGAPIRSSMEVVQLGQLPNGLPIYMDKLAHEADGIVVINRIKPHTAFRGPYESGIVKMIAIGLGKQKGAESCHKLGFGHMAEHIVQVAEASLQTGKILAGVAIIENAYDRIADIQVLPANGILAREPALLMRAKSFMPRILVDEFDVLVIDEIGKDISGDGMDPNITGRYATPFATGGPKVTRICVRRLTERTHGNANGIGVADTTTKQVFDAIDFEKTYPNALTSTVIDPVKLPMVLENDKLAIQTAIKTSNVLREADVRLVHIRTTLHLDVIRVSESLLPVLRNRDDVEIMSDPMEWHFDAVGALNTALSWR